MITMTNDQLEKINLLDTLFSALNVDELKELANSEKIIAKLKGTNQNSQILCRLIQEHDMMITDVMYLKTEVQTLKTDLQALVKVLHTDVFTQRFNQDFQNLKQKHNVY
jgi:hypothetical protein